MALDLAVSCINRIIHVYTCISNCIRAIWVEQNQKRRWAKPPCGKSATSTFWSCWAVRAESSPPTLAVDTGSRKTRFVEICANWRVRERSKGYTAALCLAGLRPFLSYLANKLTWRARAELLEPRLI